MLLYKMLIIFVWNQKNVFSLWHNVEIFAITMQAEFNEQARRDQPEWFACDSSATSFSTT